MAEQFKLQPNFTLTVSHFVKQGMEHRFEAALQDVMRQAQTFEGYHGIQLLQPTAQGQNEYLLVVRFDKQENYERWESSAIRKDWSEKLTSYIHKESVVRQDVGLAFWFSTAEKPGSTSPTKWKMALLTWIVIYPLILMLSFLAGVYLAFLPPSLRMLLISMILVVSMTYFIMPGVTKKFAFWLFYA